MVEKTNGSQKPQKKVVNVPGFYINGFNVGGSLSDVNCSLLVDGNMTATLHMSFNTTKTLAENLNAVVQNVEASTGNKILTMEAIKAGLDKQATPK
jgi:hypothetical protein